MFKVLDIAGSGMAANQQFLEVTANNITNMNTTRTSDGGPYHRQSITFGQMLDDTIGGGVKVDAIHQDKQEQLVYAPTHPDANAEGYVRFPAINLAAEMTNMMVGQRSYEANVTVFNSMKKIMEKEQEIGRI
jgi:flagellar basal-body rod protein FlgC